VRSWNIEDGRILMASRLLKLCFRLAGGERDEASFSHPNDHRRAAKTFFLNLERPQPGLDRNPNTGLNMLTVISVWQTCFRYSCKRVDKMSGGAQNAT